MGCLCCGEIDVDVAVVSLTPFYLVGVLLSFKLEGFKQQPTMGW
jgi:hypothetical protein